MVAGGVSSEGLSGIRSPFSNFFSMGHGHCNGDKTPWVMGPYNVVVSVAPPVGGRSARR